MQAAWRDHGATAEAIVAIVRAREPAPPPRAPMALPLAIVQHALAAAVGPRLTRRAAAASDRRRLVDVCWCTCLWRSSCCVSTTCVSWRSAHARERRRGSDPGRIHRRGHAGRGRRAEPPQARMPCPWQPRPPPPQRRARAAAGGPRSHHRIACRSRRHGRSACAAAARARRRRATSRCRSTETPEPDQAVHGAAGAHARDVPLPQVQCRT